MKDDILKEISEREEQVKELMKDADSNNLQRYEKMLKVLANLREERLNQLKNENLDILDQLSIEEEAIKELMKDADDSELQKLNVLLEENDSLKKRELENRTRKGTSTLDDISAEKKEIKELMKSEYINDDDLQKCKKMLQDLDNFEKKVKSDRVKAIIFLLSVLLVIALVIYKVFF